MNIETQTSSILSKVYKIVDSLSERTYMVFDCLKANKDASIAKKEAYEAMRDYWRGETDPER